MRELVASSAIYTAAFTPKPGFTKEATTVGLWLLDENMGTMTADTSGLGYDGIEVIGPAFLVQTVLGFGGALLLLAAPPRLVPWAATLGALFAAGSLAALILSTTVGLFGFVETTLATLWWESFWVEAAAVVVLVAIVVLTSRRTPR